MSEFTFEIQGLVAGFVLASEQYREAFNWLRLDFAAFAPASREPSIRITLADALPSDRLKKPARVWRKPHLSVHGTGKHRLCFYPNAVRAEAHESKGRREFWVAGTECERVREVAYTAMLSALGEALDAAGFHRVHAAALDIRGTRVLLIAPSGGGKSSLSALLSREPGVRLFSDESPLLGAGGIYPFPLRLALAPAVAQALGFAPGDRFQRARYSPKWLYPFPAASIGRPGHADLVFAVGKAGENPRVRRTNRLTLACRLLPSLVAGLGLAQMAEWMLRVNALPRLIKIAFGRAAAVIRLLRHTKEVYIFSPGPDAATNVRFLNDLVREFEKDATRAPNSRRQNEPATRHP